MKIEIRAIKVAKVSSLADVLHKLGDVRQLVVTCVERRIDGLNYETII